MHKLLESLQTKVMLFLPAIKSGEMPFMTRTAGHCER